MAKGTISPLLKGKGDNRTLVGSLISNGYVRAPGASLHLCPKKEKGIFKTGLDPNAPYIKELPKEERDLEIARVTSWRKKCEEYYGVSLEPTAPFYTEMFLMKKNQPYCPYYRLHPKKDNIFDLDNPEQLVVYAYLRVHDKYVAPSYDAYFTGKVDEPQQVSYYVKDEEVEISNNYKKNQEINKAIRLLEEANSTKQRSVARCLGLGVNEKSPPELVYNILNSFIKQGVLEEGFYKGKEALELFNTFMEMKADNLGLYNALNKALEYNIYREDRKTGIIKRGDEVIGEDKKAAVEFLGSAEGSDSLMLLNSEIQKKENIPSKRSKQTV